MRDTPSKRRSRQLLAAVVAGLLATLLLAAQKGDRKAVERELQDAYEGKIVRLRTSYKGKRLRFDEDGQPQKRYKEGSKDLYQLVAISQVEIKEDRLEFRGNRVCMRKEDPNGDLTYVRLPRGSKVQLEIQVGPEVGSTGQFDAVTAKVLTTEPEKDPSTADDGGPPGTPTKRSYYHIGTPEPEPGRDPFAFDVGKAKLAPNFPSYFHVGGEVSEPRCLRCPVPDYPKEAKGLGIKGKVTIWGIVDVDGRLKSKRVVSFTGCGLADEAMRTVREYRFEPAMLDGKPVPVAMNIEVRFNLY